MDRILRWRSHINGRPWYHNKKTVIVSPIEDVKSRGNRKKKVKIQFNQNGKMTKKKYYEVINIVHIVMEEDDLEIRSFEI
jgi:hypothetical protein